jgi:two-component system, cell cycle sensor histidine kinase and response regulator CckA
VARSSFCGWRLSLELTGVSFEPAESFEFTGMKSTPAARVSFVCIVYCILHVLTDRAANTFEFSPHVAIWYLPAGFALALLTLLGPGFFPVVLAAHLLAAFTNPALPTWWLKLLLPVVFTVNYTGIAWCIRRLVGPVPLLRDFRETVIVMLATGAAPVASAIVSGSLLQSSGLVAPGRLAVLIAQWWIGDESGIVSVVPAVMVFAAPWITGKPTLQFLQWTWRKWAEVAAQLLALPACLWLVFSSDWLLEHHAFYLCFLPLTWICLKHGLAGATLATSGLTISGLIELRLTQAPPQTILDFLLFELAAIVVGLGLGSTVTRRFRAEAKLATSEARMDRVIAGAQLGLWDRDVGTGHLTFNQRWTEMLGYTLEEVEPHERSWKQLIHPEDLPRVNCALNDHLKGRTPFYETEHRLRMKDGQWKWVLTRGSVVERDEDGRPLRVSGTHIDLTERKRAEAERHRLLEIIGATTDYIATMDLEGRTIYANGVLLRLRGHADLAAARGRPLSDHHPDWAVRLLFRDAIPAALAQGSWHGETAMLDREGREFPVSQLLLVHRDDDGQPIFLSTIIRDISLQKKAEVDRMETERRMLQAQKLESLGVLAGGIAHDFNNLLTAMLGNASLARLDLPADSPVHHSLGQIEKAAVRAAELCKEMLAYSGRSQLAVTRANLSALVEDTTQLLQVSISKKCVLKLELHQPLPAILADPTQIRQIVMNLVINASDAIGERSGFIRVSTGVMRIDRPYLEGTFLSPDLPVGDYVFLEVNDNGCGMPPDVKARIFEPFYTTKFAGHGLGLAAVLGIVRAHRGTIKVYSEPGRGTTFKLLFPALEESPNAPDLSSDDVADWRGAGPVLVVDDEETVRAVTARTLESLGFRALTAADGVEAVRAFREHASTLRLVLLDLTMPHMDGEETYRELHRINPSVPVVLMSGFTEKDTTDRFAGKKLAGFIQKPFDRPRLQAKLRDVLDPVS